VFILNIVRIFIFCKNFSFLYTKLKFFLQFQIFYTFLKLLYILKKIPIHFLNNSYNFSREPFLNSGWLVIGLISGKPTNHFFCHLRGHLENINLTFKSVYIRQKQQPSLFWLTINTLIKGFFFLISFVFFSNAVE